MLAKLIKREEAQVNKIRNVKGGLLQQIAIKASELLQKMLKIYIPEN